MTGSGWELPGVWLGLYLWTCALELPVLAMSLRGASRGPSLALQVCLGLNLLTHPALFLALRALGPRWTWAGELAVIAVEGSFLARWVPEARGPWATAGVANLISWQLGSRMLGG